MKVAFLGAGAFGTALGKIIKYNGHEAKFYDPLKFPKVSLESAIKDANVAVYVAPSEKYPEIIDKLPADLPLICASKGFLSQKPFAKFQDFSALGGAAFANQIEAAIDAEADDEARAEADGEAEVEADGEAKATNTTEKITLTASSPLSEQLFSTENIKIEYTADTLGIMLTGSLKNVYAIGAGMYGEGESEAHLMPYLENAALEMQSVLVANHCKKETIKLSCGIPDLVLSCHSSSRNFRFGRAIKSGFTPEEATIEGDAVIKSLDNFPEFVLPSSATTLNDIITKVKDYYATK